jgi:membrane protein implicated in regulation of membrane protease activity
MKAGAGGEGRACIVVHIDLGNLVFAVAMVVALVLLLVTVVLDDVVGGILDGLHMGIDVGGVSIAPVALGFMAMFGIGGLFGTTVIGLDSAPASVIGAGAGVLGALLVYGMFSLLTRSQGAEAYSISDLVGVTGRVVVGIPKGHHGEVIVSFAGTSQKRAATSDDDIRAGTTVTITGVAGSVLIVAPVAAPKEPTVSE